MRKTHLRLATLLNAFYFVGQQHSDKDIEHMISMWRKMEGNVDKLAELADALDFCFQNRHFISKYPQVIKEMKDVDVVSAFITFHTLGGVYPLRKPGQPRVSIADHMAESLLKDDPYKGMNIDQRRGATEAIVNTPFGGLPRGVPIITQESLDKLKQPSQNETFAARIKIPPQTGEKGVTARVISDDELKEVVVLGGACFRQPGEVFRSRVPPALRTTTKHKEKPSDDK